jgi:hypothetical protein
MLAYEAFANLFAGKMTQLIKQHAHPENQITLYTYWLTNASYGLTKLKQKMPLTLLTAFSRQEPDKGKFYV